MQKTRSNTVNKTLSNTIAELQQGIHAAAKKSQRDPNEITLLAVSKTRSADDIRSAYEAGLREFGENYLQESLEKIAALADLTITWHFIGQIQSNKTRPVAEHFAWFHTLDREKIAKRLNSQRPEALEPLNCCIQINLSNEATKGGIQPEVLPELAKTVMELPQLTLRGLMAIPAPTRDEQKQRENFAKLALLLRQLRDTLDQAGFDTTKLDTLSMGMSGDMESAILEGSTIVRIGTALFGERSIGTKAPKTDGTNET